MKLRDWYIIAGAIVTCFVAIWLFTLPAIIKSYNLTSNNAANIATTIGGVTGPVIGLFTSILLILTLRKQSEANDNQKLKNEFDIFILLNDDLNRDIDNFVTTHTQGGIDHKYLGTDGLNKFAWAYNFEYEAAQKELKGMNESFQVWLEAPQISLIVDGFDIMKTRAKELNPNNSIKKILEQKVFAIYDAKLATPFKWLSEGFEKYSHQRDDLTAKIDVLVKESNDRSKNQW